jgi:hypothetical protein
MARQVRSKQLKTPQPSVDGNGVMNLVKQLWQAAVNLRGSIEPADYKRYVLPDHLLALPLAALRATAG